jgi:hypothetical protein
MLGLLLMLRGGRKVQGACALAQLLDRRWLVPASEMLPRHVRRGGVKQGLDAPRELALAL